MPHLETPGLPDLDTPALGLNHPWARLDLR